MFVAESKFAAGATLKVTAVSVASSSNVVSGMEISLPYTAMPSAVSEKQCSGKGVSGDNPIIADDSGLGQSAASVES
jgi:hypothetical protein